MRHFPVIRISSNGCLFVCKSFRLLTKWSSEMTKRLILHLRIPNRNPKYSHRIRARDEFADSSLLGSLIAHVKRVVILTCRDQRSNYKDQSAHPTTPAAPSCSWGSARAPVACPDCTLQRVIRSLISDLWSHPSNRCCPDWPVSPTVERQGAGSLLRRIVASPE